MKFANFPVALLLSFLSVTSAFADVKKIELYASTAEHTPLELLRSAEEDLQQEVKKVCGNDIKRVIHNVDIRLLSGHGNGIRCAKIDPNGKRSGDLPIGTEEGAAVITNCYAAYHVLANVDCDEPDGVHR